MKVKISTLFCYFLFAISLFSQNPVILADLNPGVNSGINEWNYTGILYKDKYYLPADNGKTGLELYVIEDQNISLFMDLFNGSKASDPANFIIYKEKIYFTAKDSLYGNELWFTDGTIQGTQRVSDVIAGPGFSNPTGLIIGADEMLYFSSNDLLFRTDGTKAGTIQIIGPERVEIGKNAFASSRAVPYKDGLAIIVNNTFEGEVVWYIKKDGSAHELYRSKSHELDILGIQNVNGKLLFGLSNDISGKDKGIYVYDETQLKFIVILNIEPSRIVKLTDQLVLIKTYSEYYITDGTAGGTSSLLQGSNILVQEDPINLVRCKDQWVFNSIKDFTNNIITITDGTKLNTRELIRPSDLITNILNRENFVFYISGYTNNFRAEFWYVNCQNMEAKQFYKPAVNSGYIAYTPLFLTQDKLYFIGNLGSGREIYSISTGLVISKSNNLEQNDVILRQFNDNSFIIEGENGDFKVELLNLNGQSLNQKKVQSNSYFNFDLIQSGIYIMQISSGTYNKTIKVFLNQ